jgi:hypothetical protein
VNTLLVGSSCSGDYEEYWVLECYVSSLLTFQRAFLLPFSGSSVLKMEGVGSVKIVVNIHQATCNNNAEDTNFLLQVVNMLMLEIRNTMIVLVVLAIEGNCM